MILTSILNFYKYYFERFASDLTSCNKSFFFSFEIEEYKLISSCNISSSISCIKCFVTVLNSSSFDVEIISYGGLPFGESIEMFFKGISTPRNKALMRILGDLDCLEQTRQGIPDVIDVYGKEVFDINENYINVVLPFNEEVMKSKKEHSNVNVGVKLNKTQYSVYTLIKNNPNITYIELAKNIKKSEETVRRNIKSLVELKLINRIGSDKKGHWEIIVE